MKEKLALSRLLDSALLVESFESTLLVFRFLKSDLLDRRLSRLRVEFLKPAHRVRPLSQLFYVSS